MSKRTRSVFAAVSASILLAAGLPGLNASADPVEPASKLPPLPARHDAKVKAFDSAAAKKSADERAQAMRTAPGPKSAIWPAATDEVVTLSSTVSDNAVRLTAPAGKNTQSAAVAPKVRLRVLDRSKAAAADVSGFLLSVVRADGGMGDLSAQVTVDYSDFAEAYGGRLGNSAEAGLLAELRADDSGQGRLPGSDRGRVGQQLRAADTHYAGGNRKRRAGDGGDCVIRLEQR
jgi:hypothetical protein